MSSFGSPVHSFNLMVRQNLIPIQMTDVTYRALNTFGIQLFDEFRGYATLRLPRGWNRCIIAEHPGWVALYNPAGDPRIEYCCIESVPGKVVRAETRALTRYVIQNVGSLNGGDPVQLGYYVYDRQRCIKVLEYADKDRCLTWLRMNFPEWRNPLAYWRTYTIPVQTQATKGLTSPRDVPAN